MTDIVDELRAYAGPRAEVILADPPWHFRPRTPLQVQSPGSRRDTERHYSTLSLADIIALPVKPIAAPDAHLFLWVTGPCLPYAFKVMEAWGFKYSAVAFTWIKLRKAHNPAQLRILPTAESDLFVGLGLTTRKNAEFCLLGRRGNARREARDVREVILSPVREHSRKPDEARIRIERYVGPGKTMVELFARSAAAPWISMGNETGKF